MGMVLLADEELIGVIPRVDEITSKQWRDVGWYVDDRGRKQFGIIPNTTPNIKVNLRNEYDTSRIRSSRPGNY